MLDDRLSSLKIDRDDQPEEGTPIRLGWIAIVVAVAAFGVWWIFSRPSSVEVVTAAAREVRADDAGTTILNASGYVTARLQATVSSKVTGRVLEVLIEEGMAVEEGQVMARLDASNITVNLELTRAQAAAARAALEETRVRREEARLDLVRAERLVAGGVGSQAELDAARAAYDSLAARLAQQREQVAVAERQIGVWTQQLADAEIRAPFAGIVVSKNAQPGEMISPAAAGGGFTRTGIGTVVDMDSLEIEVDVNESYINRVEPDQEVVATLDAYSDWQIPARVIAIVPTADRQRATVKVRIGFDELDPRILPDMGVKVAFQAADDRAAAGRSRIVVPQAAVRRDAGRDIVWVVEDGALARRPIAAGGEADGGIVVQSGVSPGDRVVVGEVSEPKDGMRVKERDE